MFSGVRLCLGTALAVAALTISSATFAATASLSIDRFERNQLGAAQSAMTAYQAANQIKAIETFEDYQAWDGHAGTGNPQHTKVGSFTSFGAAGSGHSVIADASQLQVRADDTMPWGRYSADNSASLGGHWLDSNDNLGAKWEISDVGKFDSLAFFVLDAADVGGKFSIKVGDTLFSNLAGASGRLKNGNIHFVRIMLSEAVNNLTVELMHDRTNDGFGIDGAAVGVAPIPLPPAAFLLLTGIAGIAGLRRRSTRRPA